MSFNYSSCCRELVCREDCTVVYGPDYADKNDFEVILNPAGHYVQADGNTSALFVFDEGKANLTYYDRDNTFYEDNFAIRFPVSINVSNEDQTITESCIFTVGSVSITAVSQVVYSQGAISSFTQSIHIGGSEVYHNESSSLGLFSGKKHYIIRRNNKIYYYLDSTFIGETAGSDQSRIAAEYSFESTKTSTTVSVISRWSNEDTEIIWKPDKWWFLLPYQPYLVVMDASSTVGTAYDRMATNNEEEEGCDSPAYPNMLIDTVSFQRCLPPIGVRISGFKNNSGMIIPGFFDSISGETTALTHSFYEQLPGLISGSETGGMNLNAIAQIYINAGATSVTWHNGAEVTIDFSKAESVVLKGIYGTDTGIVFENMHPLDVMTNIQAYYGWSSEDHSNLNNYQGFWGWNHLENYSNNPANATGRVSSIFKSSMIDPFTFFDYHFDANGDFVPGGTVDSVACSNKFTINNVQLTVQQGIVAPDINASIGSSGIYTLYFYKDELYLDQADYDYGVSHSLLTTELKRPSSGVKAVSLLQIIPYATITSETLPSNAPVFKLEVAHPVSSSNPVLRIPYQVTDIYGASSQAVITLKYDSNGSSVTQYFTKAAEGNLGSNNDYDVVCKFSFSPTSPGCWNSAVNLYCAFDKKRITLEDLFTKPAVYTGADLTGEYNFQTGRTIIWDQWYSWDGVAQNTLQADFISLANDDCSTISSRTVFFDEYDDGCPLDVGYVVLSVDLLQKVDYGNGVVIWTPVQSGVPVILNPEQHYGKECLPENSEDIGSSSTAFTGSVEFLVFDDPHSKDKFYKTLIYNVHTLAPYDCMYEEMYQIREITTAGEFETYGQDIVMGVRVTAITAHYTDGSTETVSTGDISPWYGTGDTNIK